MIPSDVYRHVLNSVVLILQTEVDDDGDRSVSYGTGWVVDADRGLIVTNQHVVDSSEEVLLIYPRMVDRRLRTAVEDYGLTADGFGFANNTARGEVLHSENDRDLALIRARRGKSGRRVPSGVAALKLADRQVWPGERVHTIAGWPRGSESLWIYGSGTVRQVSRRTLASGAKTVVMESDIPVNHGNSGGAVVDDFGEVVAVVEGIQTNARGLSLFVGLDAVRDYLHAVLPLVDSREPEDLIKLARSHREAGRYGRGLRLLDEAIRQAPRNAGYLAERGLMHASDGDYDTAEADFDAANTLAPDDPVVQGGRGEYLWMRGKLDEAIDALTRAIRRDPENPKLYERRALARRDAEDYDRAVRDLSHAVRLAPHDANLLMERGKVYRLNSQWDAAVEDHLAAAKLMPQASEPYGELGTDLYDADRFDAAVNAFREALERAPDSGFYHFRLGDAQQEAGDWSGGLDSLTRAIELMPDHAYSRYYAGLSHRELGNHRAAVRRYRESLRLAPEEAIIHYNLALSLRELGRESEAVESFAEAHRLNDDLNDPAAEEPEEQAAADDTPAEPGRVASLKDLVGEWAADYTVDGTLRVQITRRISLSGAVSASRVSTTISGENEGEVERSVERLTLYVDGSDLMIGPPGGPYERRPFRYEGDTLHVEREDLGGPVIWRRR